MAYVPGHKHDCFLSYAHADATWAKELQEQLAERLSLRLGTKCEVWMDENKLRTGQDFTAELDHAIRASSAFIPILSRNYQGSEWCERELDVFLEGSEGGSLETGGYGRVLKVIRFPWLDDAHLGFHSKYQHISFFERDPKTGQDREFKHTSEPFRKSVDKISFHIEKLFEAVLRGMEKIFVGRTTGSAAEERDLFVREIRAAGYALSPPPLGAIPKGLDRAVLKKYIDQSRATVHVIGAEPDPAARLQIDLALEAGKKVIFCLARGAESASGAQKELITQIRENHWGLSTGAWDFLDGRSLAIRLKDLLSVLAHQEIDSDRDAKGAKRVYILCDTTTTEDANFAREVQVKITERENDIQVDLPSLTTESSSRGAYHEHLLGTCDGLLLYHDKAPLKWVARNLTDLVTAAERANRHLLRSRAVLVRGESILCPGLMTIQRQDPFEVEQLEPFLAPLRFVTSKKGSPYAGD